MTDSLVMTGRTGSYEIIDPSAATGMTALGEDQGAPVPDITVITGILVDGDSQTGRRSGDRSWTLPVQIQGTDKLDVAVKATALMMIVDDPAGFTLTQTLDGLEPNVYDCKRGTYARPRDPNTEAQGITEVTFTFNSKPFGRSTDPQTITVPATGGPAQLQVDGMNSGSVTGGTLDTGIKYEGAGSANSVTPTHSGSSFFLNFLPSRTISSTNLSTYGTLSLRIRLLGSVAVSESFALQLKDSAGKVANYLGSSPVLFAASDASWHLVTFGLTTPYSATTGFDITTVTGWGLFAAPGTATASTATFSLHLDDLRAYPSGSIGNSTAEGSEIVVPGVLGSARCPTAMQIDRGGSVIREALVHSPPVTQDPDLAILLGLTGGAVTVAAANAHYDGTYSVVAVLTAKATGTRTITATFTQKIGSTVLGVQTVVAAYSGTAGLVTLGSVTLPPVKVTDQNATFEIDVAVTSTGGTGTDTISDLVLCDTNAGQTVMLTNLASGIESIYIDEPDPLTNVGHVYASTGMDRTAAYCVDAFARISGGPMSLEPGDNKIVVVCPAGAPNLTETSYPRWLDDRCA